VISADAFPDFVPNLRGADPSPEERENQLKRYLDMAFWHSDVGNDASAVKMSEAALAIDPNCVSALSLLGCLHERTGNPELAIQAFERVVYLSPQSEADIDKLDALRSGVHLAAVPPPPSYRWLPPVILGFATRYPSAPVIGGVAAAFAIVFIGLLIIIPIAKQRGSEVAPIRRTALAEQASNVSAPPPNVTTTQPSATTATLTLTPSSIGTEASVLGTGMGSDTIGPVTKGNSDPFGRFPTGEYAMRLERDMAASRRAAASAPGPLPSVAQSGASTPSMYSIHPLPLPSASRPASADVPEHTVSVGAPQPSTPAPAPPPTIPQAAAAADQGAPAPPPSRIRITFNGPNPGDVPGDQPGSQRTGALAEDQGGALQQQAITMQNKGDYRGAESSYRSAISAYKAEISAGRDSDFARRGIDACETGIQICRASE